MKKVHLNFSNLRFLSLLIIFLFVSSSCKQESLEKVEIQNESTLVEKSFYFQGTWYDLTYKDGVPNDSENKDFIENLFERNPNIVVNHIAGETGKVYLMENKYEFNYFIADKLQENSRKRILFFTDLQKLTDDLEQEFGNIYFNNSPNFIDALKIGLTDICQKNEVQIPSNLDDFYKTDNNSYSPNQATTRWDICEVWEHVNYTGPVVNPFDFGSSTTYGDWNCFQKIEVPKLSSIPRLIENGEVGNWNDVITSGYFRVNEGADASYFTVHRKDNFKGWQENFYIIPVSPYFHNPLYQVQDFGDHHWCWTCKSLNDSISSMKVTNVWSGCL